MNELVHDLRINTAPGAIDRSAAPADAVRKAEDFESIFLAQMLGVLTHGLTEGGPLGGGDDDPFGSMLADEYGKLISRSGGIGVADSVLRELMKTQEIG